MSIPGEIIKAASTQSEDAFVEAMIASLPPIYNKEDANTVLRKLYHATAKQLKKADILVEQIKNNNYLSVTVNDEILLRGLSDLDRLKNENAFKLLGIRFTPSSSRVTQNVSLGIGANIIQLFYAPLDIDFLIYDVRDPSQSPVDFSAQFSPETNSVVINATRQGLFTLSYKDTGDGKRTIETVSLPEEYFQLGYGQGGYNSLGYNE